MTFSKNRRPGPPRKSSGQGSPGKPSAKKSRKKAPSKSSRKVNDNSFVPTIEHTGREIAYFDDLLRREVVVVVSLKGGGLVRGYVRYYDRDVISLGPVDGSPKIFLRKDSIGYLYEEA
ncbi:MAG: hypothetical protein EBU88_13750 [Acidobacteria bacterium]|nr:hypothetical protein [Acidobacteriota bacterium]